MFNSYPDQEQKSKFYWFWIKAPCRQDEDAVDLDVLLLNPEIEDEWDLKLMQAFHNTPEMGWIHNTPQI